MPEQRSRVLKMTLQGARFERLPNAGDAAARADLLEALERERFRLEARFAWALNYNADEIRAAIARLGVVSTQSTVDYQQDFGGIRAVVVARFVYFAEQEEETSAFRSLILARWNASATNWGV